jgi:pyruvate kinase
LTTTGCNIAFDPRENVDMFVCLTEDGKIARHLAKQRPKQPILACSISGQTVRQMNMVRGVVGYKIPQYMKNKTDDLINLIL